MTTELRNWRTYVSQICLISRRGTFFHYEGSLIELFEKVVNPFHATGLFQDPLKTSENQIFLGGIERDRWNEVD